MFRVRRNGGKGRLPGRENRCNKKPTSYCKATLKDKLRYRKAFHMIFDSFLFALLNAGGHEGEQLHGKEGVRTELRLKKE